MKKKKTAIDIRAIFISRDPSFSDHRSAAKPHILRESSDRSESLFRARKRKHPDNPFPASNAGRESSPVTEKSSARPFLCRVDYALSTASSLRLSPVAPGVSVARNTDVCCRIAARYEY